MLGQSNFRPIPFNISTHSIASFSGLSFFKKKIFSWASARFSVWAGSGPYGICAVDELLGVEFGQGLVDTGLWAVKLTLQSTSPDYSASQQELEESEETADTQDPMTEVVPPPNKWRMRGGQYLGEISALCFLHLPPLSSVSSLPLLLSGTCLYFFTRSLVIFTISPSRLQYFFFQFIRFSFPFSRLWLPGVCAQHWVWRVNPVVPRIWRNSCPWNHLLLHFFRWRIGWLAVCLQYCPLRGKEGEAVQFNRPVWSQSRRRGQLVHGAEIASVAAKARTLGSGRLFLEGENFSGKDFFKSIWHEISFGLFSLKENCRIPSSPFALI